MKFLIFKKKQNDKNGAHSFGTIEASCIDVASDLLLKKLRKQPGPKDGDVFVVIQDTGEPFTEDFARDGTSFRLLHYREID